MIHRRFCEGEWLRAFEEDSVLCRKFAVAGGNVVFLHVANPEALGGMDRWVSERSDYRVHSSQSDSISSKVSALVAITILYSKVSESDAFSVYGASKSGAGLK